MSRNFSLAQIKEPRVAMRVLIGVLLAANLAMAIVAFKPFGGSADDLRKEAGGLRDQLSAREARLAISKRLAQKVETARHEGTEFLTKYVVDRRTASSALNDELMHMTADSGVQQGQYTVTYDEIKGSDSLQMVTISASFEGTYQQLTKLVSLIDKSPRFLIIDSMQSSVPQNSQKLSVQFKIKTFVRGVTGADS
jgi:Tfp pilus assembly protein PilO